MTIGTCIRSFVLAAFGAAVLSTPLATASAEPVRERAGVIDLPARCQEAADRREIRRHVESIFEAFIAQDYTTVRATHTEDWRGFRGGTTEMIRGIDGYMHGLSPGAPDPPIGFEFIELDIDIEGDYASVLYLARYYRLGSDSGDVFTYLLRSIDTYRRDPSGWNQCGTNICVGLDDPPRIPTPGELRSYIGQSRIAPAPGSSPDAIARADPEILALARSAISALETGTPGAYKKLTTDDWSGFGLRGLRPVGRDAADLGAELRGEVELAELELIDISTQSIGDAGAAFYQARGRAQLEPSGEPIDVLVRFADVLRREGGRWKQRSSHVSLMEIEPAHP